MDKLRSKNAEEYGSTVKASEGYVAKQYIGRTTSNSRVSNTFFFECSATS